jgi:hypothetical protein
MPFLLREILEIAFVTGSQHPGGKHSEAQQNTKLDLGTGAERPKNKSVRMLMFEVRFIPTEVLNKILPVRKGLANRFGPGKPDRRPKRLWKIWQRLQKAPNHSMTR